MVPKAWLYWSVVGFANRGVFVAFRNSPRICILIFSVMAVFLRMERSQFTGDGPRMPEKRSGAVRTLLTSDLVLLRSNIDVSNQRSMVRPPDGSAIFLMSP